MAHKEITAKPSITADEANELVSTHDWQFIRHYVDTCRWARICEPARDGKRSNLSGAIWYIERRDGVTNKTLRWDRVLNETHPVTIEQIAIDQYRRQGATV